MHRLLHSLGLALLLLTLLAFPAPAKLIQDTWREDKRGITLDGLKNWSRLTNPDTGTIVEEGGRRLLRLRDGARMQSIGVMPYGPSLELKARLAITSPEGTAGIGFIDFSSSHYYYAYLDRAAGRLILQRGDGETSEILAESTAAVDGQTGTLILRASTQDKNTIRLEAQWEDGTKISAEDTRPAQMGSTYQIYVGIGGQTQADLHEVTTVQRR